MRKFKTVVLILALFMCFNRCERNQPDEMSSDNCDELTIEQAKAFVEMQKMTAFPIKSGNVEKQRINIRGDWKKAKTSSNSDVSVVETDLEAMGGFGFATQASIDAWNSTKNNQYLGSMSRLVVIRLKKTKQEFSFIMTVVGDKPYLESKQFDLTENFYLKRVKDLTGYVLYHKLNGDFINGWEYCDGKIVNSFLDNVQTNLPVDLKSAQYMVPIYSWETICVDHYYQATCGGASGPRTYSYSSCTEVMVYVGGVYYPDSYTGGYTGGGGGAVDIPAPLPVVDASGLRINRRVNCIYEKLLNQGTLSNFISRYFGLTNASQSFLGELNLTWKLDALEDNGITVPIGYTGNSSYYSVEIILNSTTINSRSSTELAMTMLHEALHAKLVGEYYDSVGSTDFASLLAYYQGWGTGYMNSNQQMEMLNLYAGNMATALKAFDESQGIYQPPSVYTEALKFQLSKDIYGTTKYPAGESSYNTLRNATKDCN